jgi:hypothetical protein
MERKEIGSLRILGITGRRRRAGYLVVTLTCPNPDRRMSRQDQPPRNDAGENRKVTRGRNKD